VLRPGRYANLADMNLNDRISSVRAVNLDDRQQYNPASTVGQITFFEHERFRGESITSEDDIANLGTHVFNGRASSVEVVADTWQVCDGPRFTGHCVILNPGRYPALVNFGLNDRVVSARAVNRKDANAGRDRGRVTFYEREGFGGQSFTTERRVGNFSRFGFNDRASSVEVMGAAWEVCEEAQFRGRCVVLLPGRYPSLASIGFGDRISSVRTAPNVNVNAAAVYESPMPPR
jgi:hypothetical protein